MNVKQSTIKVTNGKLIAVPILSREKRIKKISNKNEK